MIDPKTGEVARELKLARDAYGNELSANGRYFPGGGWPED
jgi:hypothetical protein